MSEPTENLIEFPQQSSRAVLDEVLRRGAEQLLAQAIQDEVATYLAARADIVDERGHRQVVRNGHLPGRALQTPVGPVTVRQPRVRDRRPVGERETFRSSRLPPYLRKTKSMEELIPWLYLKGVSTGDFSEALQALLGAMRLACRRRRSPGSKAGGSRNGRTGIDGSCPIAATFTSGPTVSTSTSDWRTRPINASASWF